MKEYTLWEMEEELKENLILYLPSKEIRNKWEDLLNRSFNVSQLQALAQPFLNLASRKDVLVLTHEAKLKEISYFLSILNKKGNKPKVDWLELVSFFLADSRNLNLYIQTLSEVELNVWKLVIRKLYVNNNMLKAVTGKNWITKNHAWGYYNDYSVCKEASWFAITHSLSDRLDKYGFYREKEPYFFLGPAFRKLFAPIFFPEVSALLESHEELPIQGLFTFNGEADFLRCFPILQALYKQDILVMGKNKMLASTIKKVSKQVNMKEFYEGDVPDELARIRASIIFPTIAMLFDYIKKDKDRKPENLLKEFRNLLYSCYSNWVSVLLPDIHGIRLNRICESTIGELIMDAFLSLTTTKSGWICVNDIIDKQLIYSTGENTLQVFKPYQMDGMDLSNKSTGEYVHLGNLTEQLGIPFLKGFFFLMGSLGMLELAYEYPSYVTSSVFNTLQYIRLTELGKYALGLIPIYTPPMMEEKQLFHLDSERLIIRSLEPGNPYESMLQDTAIPIGGHRFMMNSDSFLKNCKTEKDVTDKIDFFKQFICQGNIPDIWIDFFASLLKQCHPLKKLSKEKYVIYQLDGNNKELIRLLTTDSVLKSIIIRAEGYMILVEVNNQKKMIDRLKTYGYLL